MIICGKQLIINTSYNHLENFVKVKSLLLSALLLGVSSAALAQAGGPGAVCLTRIEAEIKKFDADLKAHDTDGKLDAKEKTDLNAAHAKLLDALTKAKADGNISAQECAQLQGLATKEAADMRAAIGVREVGHGKHKEAFSKRKTKHGSMASCKAEIKKEERIFDAKFKRGIDSGKIDDKEKADIEKTHKELLALEEKAKADGKLSADECADIHEKIVEENKKLNAAMDIAEKRPSKAGKTTKREKALAKNKRGGKGKATRDVGHCRAEMAEEKKEFAADLAKVEKAGHLSPAEKTELIALQKTLEDYEKKALSIGKLSKKECDEIHAQIVHIHDKLIEADAKN
jgi:hypothetical protein